VTAAHLARMKPRFRKRQQARQLRLARRDAKRRVDARLAWWLLAYRRHECREMRIVPASKQSMDVFREIVVSVNDEIRKALLLKSETETKQ
jgi:hypothetical protein